MTDHRTIAEVAAHLGLEADTLRYYERHGVVPSPSRDTAGRRCYAPSDVHLLEAEFVKVDEAIGSQAAGW
ncbi:hypothetical protein GCM10027030_19090 [Luteococcus sediminum]